MPIWTLLTVCMTPVSPAPASVSACMLTASDVHLLANNSEGLKLTEHCLKVIERVLDKVIREIVDIAKFQFGFVPGRGTSDAIFIVRQLQEKYLAKERNLYFAFVDLEKAFDRVPCEVLWWAIRRVSIPEWIIRTVQAMYMNAKSMVRINNSYSKEFKVKVGVHQGSVISPLLFVIVLEVLSHDFSTGASWERLYADDLVIVAETLEELSGKFLLWKNGLELRGLRVNMAKMKVIISSPNLNSLRDSGKHPCGVCRKGVGCNSTFCNGCQHWVHKKCTRTRGRLSADPSFRCDHCLGLARPIVGKQFDQVSPAHSPHELETVDSFYHLGYHLCAGGGYELASITRTRSAWKKFKELLPLLSSMALSCGTRGQVYSMYVRSVMLYASECWPIKKEDMKHLEHNERSMLRWMYHVNPSANISTEALRRSLGLTGLDTVLRLRRLRWFGHVKHSPHAINTIRCHQVVGMRKRGQPRKTWEELVASNLQAWGLQVEDALDRKCWKCALHNFHAPSDTPQVSHRR
ncbi:uncharacterized protein LOC132881740 [Neoarius graeffei]|uniref:uncharacterized protein LOC132881740 n=1 Tax=Neoarius graeffei TaxID=443677 RepID=UPI00298C0040|nr:uncharacterized protein LOC132881740 [Neoarius graeffei]